MRPFALALSAIAALALAAGPADAGPINAPGVTFDDCNEFVGLGLVPMATAAAQVPDGFVPVPAAPGLTIMLVRVVDCAGISVDGGPSKPGKLAHVGIALIGPDPTATVNNYQIWMATDHGALKGRLTAMGVDVEMDQLTFDITDAGKAGSLLAFDVSPARGPSYSGSGYGAQYPAEPVPFVANWWHQGRHGRVSMRTEYSGVIFGGTDLTVSTDAGSALAELAGTSEISFVVLNTFNAFAGGEMTVTVD